MFARYPKDRRLTLRDLIRVKVQRKLITWPIYGLILLSGVFDDVRADALAKAPQLATQLEASLVAWRTGQSGTHVARLEPDCTRIERAPGIVFHSAPGCDTR